MVSFIILLQGMLFLSASAQCTTKIEYRVDAKTKGLSMISIKSLETPSDIKIQLYDLNVGKVIDEKEMNLNGNFALTFTDVKPSFYLFYIWLPGCAKPTVVSGEKHGILIEN